MVDVSYQMVLSTLQTVGLLVGIYYYVMTLQNTRKNQNMTLETRRIQLYSNWINNWLSDEGLEKVLLVLDAEWSSYEEWQGLMQSDREYRKAYIFVADSYNYLGVMVKEDPEAFKFVTTSRRTFLYWWEKHRNIVYKERERRNDQTYCGSWEYFYNELVKYLDEHPELAP